MDSETPEESLLRLQAQSLEKCIKGIMQRLKVNQAQVQKSVNLPSGHNPTMLHGSLQPLRAAVAPGRHELLPPIASAPLKQQQPCSSCSSLPACVKGQGDKLPKRGDPHPTDKKNLTGLDFAIPLKPLIHKVGSSNKALAPPTGTKGGSENVPKKMKAKRSGKTVQDVCLKSNSAQDNTGDSLSPVNIRSPPALKALPPLKAPTPPAAPTVPTTPTPPHTIKPQGSRLRKFLRRLPSLKKASTLSVATAALTKGDTEETASWGMAGLVGTREETDVTEQKSEQSTEAGEKEEVRENKEEEKPVRKRKVKLTSKPQQTREHPELVKLPPVVCPERAILQAFRLLGEDDWEKKVEALTSIRLLSQHHAEVLVPRLHDVCLAVNREVKNLRTVVSRAAMQTLAHLYAHLERCMDAEAEGTAKTVLPKAGEANGFIREDVEMVLSHMVLSVTPSRSMNALINTGLRHRNAAVRKAAAQHLEELAEVMGVSRVLSGKKDLTDRFVHAISCLALDSAQEVRTHARNTLAFLASCPDLLKMVEKFAPQGDRVALKDIINQFL